MAGHAYICRINNLSELINQMERLAKDKFSYDKKVIEELNRDQYKRIKWFYYCDQQEGNTIRLYDSKFFEEFRDLYKEPGTYVILRGRDLGEPEGTLKKNIRDFLEHCEELKDTHQEGLSINDPAACLKYFEKLNRPNGPNKGGNGKNVKISIADEIKKRYEKLIEEMYLEASWFYKFENLLLEHRQVILEGPPGSGKTFVAEKFAEWWTKNEKSEPGPGSDYQLIQFHESYGYEDFFQGIKPVLRNGNIAYENVPGIFHKFCDKARKKNNKNTRFVLIIDEINRGKASRIFGELLYLLEYREKEIQLASGETFSIPENVYIIGTMNTADRSIALVDYALRRRFKFVTLHPCKNNDAPVLRGWLEHNKIDRSDDVVKIFCELNRRIIEVNEHFVVGHSYFMTERFLNESVDGILSDIWEFSIIPLMAEYQPHLSTKELEEQFGLDSVCNKASVKL